MLQSVMSSMGHKYGSIQITMQKPYYLAGEMVFGRIDFQVMSPVQANKLCVKFKGVEKTKIENTVHYTDANGNQHSRQEVFNDARKFFENVMVVQQFNGGTIMPGQYQFPIQFQLPPGLPGVFFDKRRESDGDDIKAAIMYKVKVFVDMPGKDIKQTQFLTLNSLVTSTPQPVRVENSKKFMFGGSGKLYMTVELAKNVFLPGETMYCKVTLKNESSKTVKAIKIKLVREVSIKAKGRSKFLPQEMQRKSFPGCDQKQNKEIMCDIVLAQNIFPTTESQLIKNVYHLDIECDVPMAGDLEVHPPIVLALLPSPGGAVMFNPFAQYQKGW